MKRKFVLLTFLMCILGGFNLSNINAQTTVTIDGADNATYSIADNWQGYGASQQIYTATEIGSAGTITKIAFHKADNTNDGNRTWSIYLKEIDATSFTNNSTYPMTSNDLVYSGTFNASSGWVTLDINDFAYNGGNLLVTVLDNSGSKSPGDQNWSYNTSIYSKCLVKSQDASIDITSSNQFNVFGGRFSIQLTFEGGAAQPLSLTASAEKGTIYNGETVQLIATASGGAGSNYTYSWSPATGLDNTTIANPTFTPTAAGTYIFRCTVSDGTETATADVTVTVKDFSGYCSIEFILNDSYGDGWNGGKLTVVASDGTNETLTLSSGSTTTYTLDIKTGSNVTVTYTAGSYGYENQYTIKYEDGDYIRKDGSGETGSNYITEFTTSCGPQILFLTISADKKCIPTDGKVQLTAAAQNGTGNYTYTWSSVDGLTANNNTATFTPTTAGTYTFTCTVSDGETTATDDVTVTVYEKPNLAKQYRIKVSTSSHTKYGQYFHINSTATPGDNTNVIVNTSTESNNQIFTLEDAGNGNYYLRSADGYYIKCGTNNLGKAWNVYAYSTTEKTPILFDYVDGSNFYLRDYDKAGDNYFKVENGKIYCNAPSSNTDVVTWTLEEAIVAEPEKPTAPTNLTANASSYNTIDLSWNAVNGATSYNVYLKGSGSKIGSVNGTSFQVTELDGEKEYCFTVTAVNIVGESDPSEEECTTTPAEPVGCKIIFELRAAGDYGWGNNGGLAVYYTGGPIGGDILDLTSGTSKTYSYIWTEGTELSVILLTSSYPEEMGLTIKYENGVVIRNYNIGEISSSLNNNMFLYRHIVECSTLPVPTVNAVAVGKSAIKLTWDNLGGASGYNVYDREGNLIVGNITGTTTTVYDLSASTEYCFTVTSIFEDEESEHSEEACATTSDSDTNSGTIGNGNFTTSYIPIETYNKYSYSQQSYTKGDIEAIGGSEGYITSIAYNVENVYTAINTRNIRVFMTNATNEITFTDGNGLTYPIQNSDLVFEGPVTFTPGWVEINFDTPFAYNGNNILVTVIDDTGETDTGDIYCYAHSKYTNTQCWSIRGNSADNKIELTSSLEGKGFQSRNDIKFTFTSPYADLVFDGEGNWNNTANWNLRRLPAENEEITITGNAVITNDVTINSISMDGGSLTLESGSLTVTNSFTNTDASAFIIKDGAQVFQTNEDVKATFRMNVKAPASWTDDHTKGWQFIASPMSDFMTSAFETEGIGYDLFKYVGGLDLEWVNYKGHTSDFEEAFKQGRGYIASYETESTVEFEGTLNNDTSFDFPLNTFDEDDHYANFHLLGNPFAFDMKWNNNIAASGLAEGYAIVTLDGGYEYATDGEIKVGDGFFVKVTGDEPSLSYNANTRNRSKEKNYINIIASGKAGKDNVIINFNGDDRPGFAKLDNFNKDIAVIYVQDNGKRSGILSYDEDVEEINLYFDAKKMGEYTINAISETDFASVTLVDLHNGNETDLLTSSYTFKATSSDDPDRFVLRISRENTDENFIYRSGDDLVINAKGMVQIIDIMGRIIYSENIINGSHRIDISNYNSATYIVRVVNANEVKTQKIVVY